MGKRTLAGSREEKVELILTKAKGEVCKEFEKVCQTELSFGRMKKEMHDIFDQVLEEVLPYIK